MTSSTASPATEASSTLYSGPGTVARPFREDPRGWLQRLCDALHDGEPVGTVTDLIWSSRLGKNIGYVWLPIALAAPGASLEIVAPDGGLWPATSAAIPFLDPRKDVPKS
jgi:glycine cleavage system aminomethyltransferase T